MRVLYINNYGEQTGWSAAGRNYILALDAAGIDVVPRKIHLGHSEAELPERIAELEKKPIEGCDIVIQHILPHMMEFDGHFRKNIGLVFLETDCLGRTSWSSKINCMDEVIVCCKQNKDALLKSGVNIPIHVVPIPTNTERFEQKYEPLPIPELQGKFVFYFMGEVTRRKNLVALLKAFHLEFSPYEQIALLIKGSIPGANPEQAGDAISAICKTVKEHLKLYDDLHTYSQEIILTKQLSEEEVMRCHATGDCLVAPSFGEAWGQIVFDAMCMGKTPITTATGGMLDYLGEGGILVNGVLEPAFGMTETFHDLYSGREQWISIDINELRMHMRSVFQCAAGREEMKNNGLDKAYDYSYDIVGKQLKEILEA